MPSRPLVAVSVFFCSAGAIPAFSDAGTASGQPSETRPQIAPEPQAPGVTGTDPEPAARTMLLADDTVEPTVTVRWHRDGRLVERSGTRAYAAPLGGDPLDDSNIRVYLALGGTRLDLGAGHPNGAILRVGLTKVDSRRAFFAGIDPGSEVEIEVRGAVFNQPVKPDPTKAMMHLKYAQGDIEACSLPLSASNQFLLADPRDTLGGFLRPGVDASPGALDAATGRGRAEARTEDDGSITYRVVLPYGLLRHLQDPWASELPGTFFEPVHLHAEVEILPVWAEPLQIEHPAFDTLMQE